MKMPCQQFFSIPTNFFSVRISSNSEGLKPSSVLACPSAEPCSPLFGDTLGLPESDFCVCKKFHEFQLQSNIKSGSHWAICHILRVTSMNTQPLKHPTKTAADDILIFRFYFLKKNKA